MMTFGKLEPVEIRSAWPTEYADFTPWLCEPSNLAQLSKAIGVELEVVTSEFGVGQYSLDILAQHTGTTESVIIENQFGGTDHRHLGQLLTYAAGVGNEGAGARTIVWVAEKFTEPHRAALDWLNKTTEPSIRFFGVELELWKIGDSVPAPRFSVVSKPNQWQKQLTASASAVSANDRMYIDFWNGFYDYCDANSTTLSFKKKPRKTWWLPTESGRRGFGVNLNAVVKQEKMVCQLWIEYADAKAAFHKLLAQRETLETKIGESLTFDEKIGKSPCEIFVSAPADIQDREQWETVYAWLKAHGERFLAVFAPLVQEL